MMAHGRRTMRLVFVAFGFQMMTSSTSTSEDKIVPESGNDLEAFEPGPSNRRLDDKAAILEQENARLKSSFNRERYIYAFSIGILFNIIIASFGNHAMIGISLVGSILLFLGLASFLDFPWITPHLNRWHDLAYKVCERWFLGKKADEIEPLPEETDASRKLG
jgi:hypothetical protein